MKLTCLLLLVSVAAALARPQAPPSIIKNVRFEPDDDGHYEFEIETSDGIRRSETGSQTGPESQTIEGVISFTLPDGTPFKMTFVADENGFRPQSSLLPVAPPMPAHSLRQLRLAALDSDEDK
ncbi:cuticle protein AMP1A [Penaeus vannamei]|uniref:cuticle protein AMP1A n=1 Tax=Penaeus vannamei TaxID=6689 RepID=UPI000F685ABE|nr:cuticle protein AMP1A-like [Penaeus vannamei]